ncbi:MAG: hypothetical protein K8W52_02235 [Deltaproteobacteria bacterium]|nr:hypothetical protein [Deltaproteobacteria bacterium]
MTRGLLVFALLAACHHGSSHPPAAPPPATGDGELYLWLDSPTPRADITTHIYGEGREVAVLTAPSGGVHVRLPAGRYQLRFEVAEAALPACTTEVDVPGGGQQRSLNMQPPPAGCTLWRIYDAAHPMTHGAAADITTTVGAHQGYRVLPCDRVGNALLFVEGDGVEHMPTGDPDALDAWVERVRREVETALAPIAGGAGFGVACRADQTPTITIYVSDRRQVDWAIARLAEVIRTQHLGIGFTIELIAEGVAD